MEHPLWWEEKNGVGVKLKENGADKLIHIHCIAHRLALCVSDSVKKGGLTILGKLQNTLCGIFKCYA
mgnify:CR=1 FL=1